MSRNKEQYALWQHPNGTIYIVWTEQGEHRALSKRVSTWTSDWKAAEQYRAQFIADLNNPAAPAEPTIKYLLERYRDEHGPLTRSPKTIDRSLKVLIPFFGDLFPSHITNQLLRQFALANRHNSDGTILRRLGVLMTALHYAEGNRWIAPVPPIAMPVAHPAPRDLWLTREQVNILIEKAKSSHIRLFIQLAVTTAQRSGAILDLTWPQINFEQGIIDFGRGWGKKKRAIVPINEPLREALNSVRDLAQTNFVIEFEGKGIKSVKTAFRRLCKECCITASPHVLRHTAATWMVIDGVPLAEVARLLGNSEAMVEKVYGKHSPDYLRRAVGSLNWKKPVILQL